MTLATVILAAGNGKRMQSQTPKVLHVLGGKPLLEHVGRLAENLSDQPPIIIYGFQGEQVKASFSHKNWQWAYQDKQLGTGHAMQQAIPYLQSSTRVLVLYGDVPLIPLLELKKFIAYVPEGDVGIITANLQNPFGYGRILRDSQQKIMGIVEEKDADSQQKKIIEINSGIYLFPKEFLLNALPKLEAQNAQGEFYLTDCIAKACQEKINVTSYTIAAQAIQGINSPQELARAERIYQMQQAHYWMEKGVRIADPARFDVRGDIEIAPDVFIDINVILSGTIKIASGCQIGAHTILNNVELAENVMVHSHSVIDGAVIGRAAIIGPFARIRPKTHLSANTHIGNFVEVKNSFIDEHSKANHLSYLGDSQIGRRVNIGAGTITCNYDGANKHETKIGDDVHIGSNSALIAPVSIGKGGTIGAGSIITESTADGDLTIARAKQISIAGWQRPKKK